MKVDACDLDIHDHTGVQTQKEKKKKPLPPLSQKSPNTHNVKL